MNKKIAFDNRLCYERDVLRQHALHQQKLQTMLPTCASPSKVYLDSNAPPRRAHLANNRKKLQLEKERQTEIYTQNQRLAAKMEHILSRQETAVLAAGTPGAAIPASPRSPKKPAPQPLKPVHSPAYVHMPGIRLDASQTPMVDCYLSPEYAMGRGNACKKTTLVNRGVQRQRQQQIEDENRRLQDRLKAQKPFYNTKKWDADWQQVGAKFQHLRQDATVGHLLPKTSHGTTSSTVAKGSPTRSPLAASRRIKTRDGLPSLKPKTSHGSSCHGTNPPSRGGRLQQKLEGGKSPSSTVPTARQVGSAEILTIDHSEYSDNGQDGDDEDVEPEIVECGAFALLEATTRKGVEIGIEELQVELRDAASGCVQPGDRGLLVRGRWGDDVETEIIIAIDTLARIAQEIDDLEMMIKLETVSTLPDGSSFPRLSVLLTDDELQRLLLKLVQVLAVKLSEDETQLEITSRLLRPPSPSTRDDKTRPTCRPRTCPSTLPSESHATFEFVHVASPDQNEKEPTDVEALLDVGEDETQQYHRVLCKQLTVLLNESARRTGFRARSGSHGFYLLQFWLHAQDAELHVTLLSLSPGENEPLCSAIPLDGALIVAMLEEIQHRGVSPVQAARRFIRGWLATADKPDTDQ